MYAYKIVKLHVCIQVTVMTRDAQAISGSRSFIMQKLNMWIHVSADYHVSLNWADMHAVEYSENTIV